MIAVIDYNMGNLASIRNALEHLGAEFVITRDPVEIKKASKIILPGVGSFRKAMNYLSDFELLPILEEQVNQKNVPILGICLGMQLLADWGTEDAEAGQPTRGLGWIQGTVKRIEPTSAQLRIPHMGFNDLKIKKHTPILNDIPEDAHFYFVHSYHFCLGNVEDVIAVSDYGQEIVAMVARRHIYGVQFHPEKSQTVGLRLIKNFLDLSC